MERKFITNSHLAGVSDMSDDLLNEDLCTKSRANKNGVFSEETEKTFEELLKIKKYQSEFDKKVSKALKTAKLKWELDYEKNHSNAKEEEKLDYEKQKKLDELSKKEKEINTRELKKLAYEVIFSKEVSRALFDIIYRENFYNYNRQIEVLEKAFSSIMERVLTKELKFNSN